MNSDLIEHLKQEEKIVSEIGQEVLTMNYFQAMYDSVKTILRIIAS